MRAAVCTIIARNYLARARVLMASVRSSNPELGRFVVLADEFDGFFEPEREEFTTIRSCDLGIPHSDWFHFRCTLVERCTAIEPYALEFLLRNYDLNKIIYLDPDIEVFASLQPILESLELHEALITPHFTRPIDDGRRPRELDILRVGAYNLGFLAVSNRDGAGKLLAWLKEKLRTQCIFDIRRGLFVDQKWMDLAPGMFPCLGILLDPGCNVAFWNLSYRRIEERQGRLFVNWRPLIFFHYSGFEFDRPEELSRHQDRFASDQLGIVRDVLKAYTAKVYAAGHTECRDFECVYDRFENGMFIPPLGRSIELQDPGIEDRIQNPFSDEGSRAFVRVWNEPTVPPSGRSPGDGVTALAYRIYQSRPDIQEQMPDVFRSDRVAFLRWLQTHAKAEHAFTDPFLEPVVQALATSSMTTPSVTSGPNSGCTDSGLEVDSIGERSAQHSGGKQISPDDLGLGRLVWQIYTSRPDVQVAFCDPAGSDRFRFLTWLLTSARHEYDLDSHLIGPLREEWNTILRRDCRLAGQCRHRLGLAFLSLVSWARRRLSGPELPRGG